MLAFPEKLGRIGRTTGAVDWEREIAVQFIGRYDLRGDEVSSPADQHLRWSENGKVWLFEVRGKNTAGDEPKVRDAWMTEVVADDIHKYSRERRLAADDPWVSASTSTVRRWVREARQQLL